MGFSQVAGQALYLDDLFSFFEIAARDRAAAESTSVPGADQDRASRSRTSAFAIPAPSAGRCAG